MNQLTQFQFNTKDIRVIEKDGQPWFIAKDVAELLGYTRPRDAVKDHCKGGVKMALPSGKGGNQSMVVIPEGDVYRLIIRSKMPEAVKFEKWVMEELLPNFRKGGNLEGRVERLEANINKLIEVMGRFIESQANQKPKLIEESPAKLTPRDEIRKIINSYTHHTQTEFRANWNLLYQECYYRLHKNFRQIAQNKGANISGIDVAEEEGFIYDMLLVARDIFQLGRS